MPLSNAERFQKLKAKRIAAGLCVKCKAPPRPAELGKLYCLECNTARSRQDKAARADRRLDRSYGRFADANGQPLTDYTAPVYFAMPCNQPLTAAALAGTLQRSVRATRWALRQLVKCGAVRRDHGMFVRVPRFEPPPARGY